MDRVAELLANFPGPVTLQPSRWKWILAASAVLFGGGIAQKLERSLDRHSGLAAVAVFGMLMLGAAVVIFIAGLRLSLDDEGFTLRVGYRSQRWRWSDVGDFAIAEYLHNMPGAFMRKRIGFNDKRLSKTAGRRAIQHRVDRTRLRLARWLLFDGLRPSDGGFGTAVVAMATAGPRRANWRASLKHPLPPPAKTVIDECPDAARSGPNCATC